MAKKDKSSKNFRNFIYILLGIAVLVIFVFIMYEGKYYSSKAYSEKNNKCLQTCGQWLKENPTMQSSEVPNEILKTCYQYDYGADIFKPRENLNNICLYQKPE